MATTRLFYASDIHGSDLCFRKFLGAARAFQADALVLGGDLTGKILVPVVKAGSRYTVYSQTPPLEDVDASTLIEVRKKLEDFGQYVRVLHADELEQFQLDADLRQQFLEAAALESVIRWLDRAEEFLRPLGVECFMMAGNDDHVGVVQAIEASSFVVNHDEKVVEVRGRIPLIGLGSSNFTPFSSPRELSEDEIAQWLESLFSALPDPGKAILNTHCPPFGTGLDFAPELGDAKDVVSYGGQPRMVPVGSTAILESIQRFQPMVGLHGHCHDSKHRTEIGKSLCVNPGSQYSEGVLVGVVVDLMEGANPHCQFVSG